MVGLATFMIVSREDVPLYEADLGGGGAPKKDDAAHLHQFVMHAARWILWTSASGRRAP